MGMFKTDKSSFFLFVIIIIIIVYEILVGFVSMVLFCFRFESAFPSKMEKKKKKTSLVLRGLFSDINFAIPVTSLLAVF